MSLRGFFLPRPRDAACRVSSKAESPTGAKVDSRGREPTVQNTGNKKTEPRRGGTWQGTRCRPCGARVVSSSHPHRGLTPTAINCRACGTLFLSPPCRDTARCVSSKAETPAGAKVHSRGREPTVRITGKKNKRAPQGQKSIAVGVSPRSKIPATKKPSPAGAAHGRVPGVAPTGLGLFYRLTPTVGSRPRLSIAVPAALMETQHTAPYTHLTFSPFLHLSNPLSHPYQYLPW